MSFGMCMCHVRTCAMCHSAMTNDNDNPLIADSTNYMQLIDDSDGNMKAFALLCYHFTFVLTESGGPVRRSGSALPRSTLCLLYFMCQHLSCYSFVHEVSHGI